MRLFEAACRVSLKHLTDEILSGKNLFISSAAATVPEVMSAEEEEDLSSCFFCHLLARTRGMLIQKPDESWNFNLQ